MWLWEMRGFKVRTAPWRDMNYSHLPAPTPPHNNFSINSTATIHFQLLMPNLSNELYLCAVYQLEGERSELLESHYPPYTLKQTLCPRPTSRFSSQRTMHSHTNSGDLVLIGILFLSRHLLCWGCCKSRLCSECEVCGSNVSPVLYSISLNQPSWGGDTHLLYGILLSLHLAVTMAAAIKRFSSHTHYLISPPNTPPPYPPHIHTLPEEDPFIDFHCSYILSAEERI